MPHVDDLIARLRARAADPDRRTETRPTVFSDRVSALDLGGLLAAGLGARNDLARTLAGIRRGALDPDLVEKAEQVAADMSAPVPTTLPAPADEAALARAEARIAFALPPTLRRLYAEVADGGFGPSTGLIPIAGAVDLYLELRAGDPLPRGRSWPDRLLPIVREDMVLDCIEASGAGRVVTWDPDGLGERTSEAAWSRSFSEAAASLEEWLETWLTGPTPAERFEAQYGDQMRASMIQSARESRAMIAKMTPVERAAMGLPEVGWERVVWGGLGLDDEDSG